MNLMTFRLKLTIVELDFPSGDTAYAIFNGNNKIGTANTVPEALELVKRVLTAKKS
jgi:hypothetical protein